jgi:hypothetical protein
MQFANYNAFRTTVEKLIEGDDIGDTFDVSTLDTIIGLAEQRVYRDLRASTMVSALSETVTDNVAPLPDDLIELRQVYFAGKAPVEVVPLDRLRRLAETAYPGGTPRYCAQDGDTLTFWPEASGTVLGSYYARPEDLKTVTWADATTFARHPDVFIFAALVEAMPFLGMEAKAAGWDARYQMALMDAMQDERTRVYGSGRLRTRTS